MRPGQLIRFLAAVVVILLPVLARAEPYLMVRTGAKCSACHTNQTGGGKRTPFAHIHAKDILQDLDLLPIPLGVKAFDGEVNSYLSIGSDLRVRNTTTFGGHINKQGEVERNQAFRPEVLSNDTTVFEFLGYGQIDLWPDLVTLYADEEFTGGANNREAFALLKGFLPWDSYIKVGRMFPTFGLRVQDDQAYVRARSGYTFQNPDTGAEFGTQPGPFYLGTTITNGTSGDKDVSATVNGYGVFEDVPVVRNVLAGASFARQTDKRDVASFYLGSNLGALTYLAEFDPIWDRTVASVGKRDQYAAYSELDYLLFDWLNLRGTFEFVKVSQAQDQTRYTIGAEPFINHVLQPRIQYRINNGVANQPDQNHDELWLELHVFL
ncbi:MAG: hypothetical protein E6J71_01310 [Deltaproteobacteria bacterium]|nr:MAG: hypothetical protein E6J77_11675 [Deltaproteobacteria bacterium]TMB24430.1 MAG: hypothetical protein E6J71_01310 [Deltaproteobacteria bacterium]